MFDLADAAVSFAGGLGTLDETFEFLTWKQLGLHSKPIIVCDVAGSAKALLGAIDATVELGFAGPETPSLFEVVNGVDDLLTRLR
jgi:predicted Rossmann-fold nucleotide-binding protein